MSLYVEGDVPYVANGNCGNNNNGWNDWSWIIGLALVGGLFGGWGNGGFGFGGACGMAHRPSLGDLGDARRFRCHAAVHLQSALVDRRLRLCRADPDRHSPSPRC